MKTAIYARKSSESEDRQVQSIEDQLRSLKELAKRERIWVDEIFTESKSAKAPHVRPEFKRLIDGIEAGEINRILTWSMNRMSRNHLDGGTIAHLLQTGKLIAIHTIDRTYRPEDNALLMSIENGMATSFIQDLTKNVRRGMAGKIERGWYPGRPPLGYYNNHITGQIDVDPVRFPLVRKAWDMLLTGGMAVSEIEKELLKLGLNSYNPDRSGKPLTRSVLYNLFSNPFYTGKFVFQSTEHPGKHKPMISIDEFENAQIVLGRKADRRSRKHYFTFGGLLRCGICGCRIVGDRRFKTYKGSGRQVTYTYYHCTNGKGGCRKVSVTEAELEKEFETAFSRIEISRTFYEWASHEAFVQVERESLTSATSAVTLSVQIGKQQARLKRLKNLLVDGEINPDDYRETKNEIEIELASLVRAAKTFESADQRILKVISEKLELAATASNYRKLPAFEKRGKILTLGGPHFLTLGKLQISIDPVLRKITTFKPLKNGCQIPEIGDFIPSNSIWSTIITDIRKIALAELERERSDGTESKVN